MHTDMSKKELMRILKKHNIANVQLGYSGGGDDGQLNFNNATDSRHKSVSISFITETVETKSQKFKDGKWVKTTKREKVTLEQIILNYGYGLLNEEFGGWEINDGSSGEIEIHVESGKVTVDHSAYYTESTDTTKEF